VNREKPFDISKKVVWEAYQRVRANKGAVGVDAESIVDFEKDLKGNLYKIWNRMSSGSYFQGDYTEKDISLYIWIPETLETIRPLHQHRQVRIELDLQPTPPIRLPEVLLGKTLIGLVRNAIENTPDGSRILIKLHEHNGVVYLEVIDFGVGIDTVFQKQIFHGFVHPVETKEYSSGTPYDFMTGGKGGDLLRIKLFSERFGFRIEFMSRRCPYVQKHGKCPGNVETCSFYLNEEESCKLGGSLFQLEFPSNLFAYQASS